MKITFTEAAWDDYIWLQQNNRPLVKRVNQLLKEITREPFTGIGKPEPLKGDLSGKWSRRINYEHRLVYEVRADHIVVIACRYHY